jgi:rhamnose transport system ATP-binding protein
MVAMARALSRNCRLLIMDEPTASLSARETQTLLGIIRQLRADGVSVLYVSHRLEEIFQIADRVTVLRDGQRVATSSIREMNNEQLIRLMVGREIDALLSRPERAARIGEVVLEVRELTRSGAFNEVSFSVRSGETVGLAGLVGAGRSEIARAIFGVDRYDSGMVRVGQRCLAPGSVTAAMAAGLALVPEDRQHEGLVLPMSVGQNVTLAILPSLQRLGWIRRRREAAVVEQQLRELTIRAEGPRVPAATLSGGNQQKLVLGKWLATQPKVLILDEPTRGIDVGAKAQVHRLIRELADRGVALLVISSELPELLAISDRILVVRQGRLVGELDGRSTTQTQVLELALPDAQEVTA